MQLKAGTSVDIPVELVQSVPAEVDLAQPGVPFTKDVWIGMIRHAKRSIRIAQFYLSEQQKSAALQLPPMPPKGLQRPQLPKGMLQPIPPRDISLQDVVNELQRAAARGVSIQILVSNALLDQYPEPLNRLGRMRRVHIRVLDLSAATGGVLHAKYWIVDGRQAFVGSQNFDWRALSHIQELGVRIGDRSVVKELRRIFKRDWNMASQRNPGPPGPSLGRMLSTIARPLFKDQKGRSIELVASPPILNPPGIRSSLDALKQLIQSSRIELKIQLLYYSPVEKGEYWSEIDSLLREMAVSGTRIKLLVSDWGRRQPQFFHLKSLAQLGGIEVRVMTIPPYSCGEIPFGRICHAKYMVVDSGVLWLGTGNWLRDDFLRSRNVDLIFKSPALARQVESIFDRLWSSQYSSVVS